MTAAKSPTNAPAVPGHAVIVGVSSDIGAALAERWHQAGWSLAGTHRTHGPHVARLEALGIQSVACDLAQPEAINAACKELAASKPWDVLVLGPGLLEPIGPFESTDFDAWEASVTVNFTAQLRIVHAMLAHRNRAGAPLVLFFAGGGTNTATVNYSAYTVSKIALIKMCELLAAEIPDTRFTILGPGWVRTKIHDATLAAGKDAGEALSNTQDRLRQDDFVPMSRVLDCIDWAVAAPHQVVSGRNFSVVHDPWGTAELDEALRGNLDLYRLRRAGNDRNF